MTANHSKAFTLVELLIVIVVIAILAAISVVAYNGVQERARDSQRKSDIAALVKATKLYAVDYGNYATVGCATTTGTGWLHYDYNSTESDKSINACLMDDGYLSRELIDPAGTRSCSGLTCHAYIKCSGNLGTFYMANLETLPHADTDTDHTNCASYDTQYGVNYVLKVG